MKAIIFDLFGVVCPELGTPWIKTSIPEAGHATALEYFKKGDLGTISEEDYWNELSKLSGIAPQAIRENWYAKIDEVPGMFAVIDEARKSHRVALCTNTSPWAFAEVNHRLGLHDRFDEIVTSYETGSVKPNPEIYQSCLDRLGTAPEATLFTDDREVNIRAAEDLGVQGVLFTGTAALRQRLAELTAA